MAEEYSFDDEVYAIIVKASVNLLLEEPFFGTLVGSLDLILCDSKSNAWCTTAATDGKFIYFNRDFVLSLKPRGVMFVLAHEVLHCLYDHLGRRQGRDPKIWNIANDLMVNYTLQKSKVGEMPPHGLYDERFNDEMHSEEIYEFLDKNRQEIEMFMQKGMDLLDQHLDPAVEDLDDGDDDGGDEQDEQGSGGSGDDEGEGQDGEGNGGGQGEGDDDGDGNGDGQGDGDGDGDESQGQGGGGQKKVKVTVLGKDGKPRITKQEADEVREKMRGVAVQAMQAALATAGNVPMSIRKRLQDLIEPKMDWRALLDSHLRSALKDDFTFMRLSRRDFGGGFVLPAQDVLETVEVDIALDVSGSMSDEMVRDILSEVKGIMETFPDFKLRVLQFDTKVYGFTEFTPHNLDDINKYERLAGGGTQFECVWEYWKKNDIEPHKGVLFTDGYPCGSWGDPSYCDMLYVIHGNGKKANIKAPFGQTAYYEEPATVVKAAAWLRDGFENFEKLAA
jgi:predicted metal-dependent peptidase